MTHSTLSAVAHSRDADADRTLADEVRRQLDNDHFVHLTDVPDAFDHASFLAGFGEFFPGPFGETIADVVPEAGMDDVYYGGNRRALLPHTECYEFPGLPPRYLALWCVVPPEGDGGETTVFDAASVVAELSPDEREELGRPVYAFQASEGLRRLGSEQRAVHPILDRVDGHTLLRFSCNNVEVPPDAPRAHDFIAQVRERFEADHVAIRYRRNDLLLWDNWRVLHSRTAFADPRRRLRRVQIRHWSTADR